MRALGIPLTFLVLSSCVSLERYEYPSEYHQYESLALLKAPPIEQIEGKSYRLDWRPVRKRQGLILANCINEKCKLELRYTNGVGTYRPGKLAGIRRKKITLNEFSEIEQSFEKGGFYQLPPTLREGNVDYGFTVSEEKGEEELICLHAPAYYLESYRNGEHYLLYRYCQDDYDDGLMVAMPLIELAEAYFPKEMEGITALWLQEKRSTEQKKVIEQNKSNN